MFSIEVTSENVKHENLVRNDNGKDTGLR